MAVDGEELLEVAGAEPAGQQHKVVRTEGKDRGQELQEVSLWPL